MNTRSVIASALVAAFVAAPAFAQTGISGQEAGTQDSFTPSRTRAEVQAEFADYKAAGVNPWSTSYNQLKGFQSATSREQVRAAYIADRDAAAAPLGEDSGSFAQAKAQRATRVSPTLASAIAGNQLR